MEIEREERNGSGYQENRNLLPGFTMSMNV